MEKKFQTFSTTKNVSTRSLASSESAPPPPPPRSWECCGVLSTALIEAAVCALCFSGHFPAQPLLHYDFFSGYGLLWSIRCSWHTFPVFRCTSTLFRMWFCTFWVLETAFVWPSADDGEPVSKLYRERYWCESDRGIAVLSSTRVAYIMSNWAFTRYDRRTDRSGRLVGPTSRMKRLRVPIVRPTGRPDPGYVRLVCQDQSDRPVGPTIVPCKRPVTLWLLVRPPTIRR